MYNSEYTKVALTTAVFSDRSLPGWQDGGGKNVWSAWAKDGLSSALAGGKLIGSNTSMMKKK